MGKTDPNRFEVHKALRLIIKQASKVVQSDYRQSLTGKELRFLVAVYLRRATNILGDSDTKLKEKDGILCLGRMEL